MKYIALLMALLFSLPVLAAQNVALTGKNFYLDGKPWLPKGIDVEAFNRPIGNYESAALQASARQVRQYWGPAEIGAIKRVFGAQVLRFTISQPGLDPQSTIYSRTYRDEVLNAIRQARANGFVVIVNMDAQGENGVPNLPCMPNDSTKRAWITMAPSLMNDPGVMFELFNEPCRASWDQARKEWASEMQGLVDMLRGMGGGATSCCWTGSATRSGRMTCSRLCMIPCRTGWHWPSIRISMA